jgi:hypothetical protein
MKRERVNYDRKLTSGNEADRNQGARRESLNGEIGIEGRVAPTLVNASFKSLPDSTGEQPCALLGNILKLSYNLDSDVFTG